MKKLLYIFTLISSFLLAGCTSETENLFGESASNRVEEAMENAQKILIEAPNGWNRSCVSLSIACILSIQIR